MYFLQDLKQNVELKTSILQLVELKIKSPQFMMYSVG